MARFDENTGERLDVEPEAKKPEPAPAEPTRPVAPVAPNHPQQQGKRR